MKISLLTFNIHKLSGRNVSLPSLKRQLKDADLDFAFLQEVRGAPEAQFEALADQVWDHYAYAKNAVYEKGNHGNAILSKYPIVHSENINVSSFRRASRSILHAIAEIPETKKRIHLLCVHFGLFEHERKRQVQTLCQKIKTLPLDDPLLLAGDFNDWNQKSHRQLIRFGLTETHAHQNGKLAKTFPNFFPFLSLDRIYTRGLSPTQSLVLTEPPWNHQSDHLGIRASFELRDK